VLNFVGSFWCLKGVNVLCRGNVHLPYWKGAFHITWLCLNHVTSGVLKSNVNFSEGQFTTCICVSSFIHLLQIVLALIQVVLFCVLTDYPSYSF
jgi:hypothetical protein